jgi:hypothetical protein
MYVYVYMQAYMYIGMQVFMHLSIYVCICMKQLGYQ